MLLQKYFACRQGKNGKKKFLRFLVVQDYNRREGELYILLTQMLGYFLGKQDKGEKKIEADITNQFNIKLKTKFCQICSKNPANKVAFGKEFKPSFTCANCQITAVGGSVQRLGPKFLIPIDKFSDELTKELINYQSNQKTPPVQHKKMAENCEGTTNKVKQLTEKIAEEYKKMKTTTKAKHEQLLEESKQQNTISIFEQVGKLAKQKKLQQIDNGRSILKRSMVNNKGLTFYDEEAIEQSNQAINDRFNAVRKEGKIKLKPLEDLIDELNAMQF